MPTEPTTTLPLLLVRGGHVLAPTDLGQQDVLIAAGKILAVGHNLAIPASDLVEVVDAQGMLVLPGFIDGHVHILGGGGEGGPQMRTRDVLLSDVTRAGVTTVIGMLGTDCLTRGLENLLAKTGALTFEGITAYALTGGYPVPTPTLMGSVARDIYFIESVVGVGEVAICDHRSSQPTVDELTTACGRRATGWPAQRQGRHGGAACRRRARRLATDRGSAHADGHPSLSGAPDTRQSRRRHGRAGGSIRAVVRHRRRDGRHLARSWLQRRRQTEPSRQAAFGGWREPGADHDQH